MRSEGLSESLTCLKLWIVWINKKTIIGCALAMIWRITQFSECIIRRGRTQPHPILLLITIFRSVTASFPNLKFIVFPIVPLEKFTCCPSPSQKSLFYNSSFLTLLFFNSPFLVLPFYFSLVFIFPMHNVFTFPLFYQNVAVHLPPW